MIEHQSAIRNLVARPIVCLLIPWLAVGLIALISLLTLHRLPVGIDRTVYVTIAAVQESLFEFDDAIATLNKISKSKTGIPDLKIETWRIDLVRKCSLRSFLTGHFDDAVSGFTDCLAKNPNDYFTLLHLAISLYKNNEPQRAIRITEQAMAAFPDRQDTYILRGHIHLSQHDILSAESDYRKARKLAAGNGSIYVDIGDAYRAAGHPLYARKIYLEGFERDPNDPFILLRLAETALFLDQDREQAGTFIRKAKQRLPVFTAADQLEGFIHQWQPGDVIPYFSTAILQSEDVTQWIISPSKILYEYFRDDWQGYSSHE